MCSNKYIVFACMLLMETTHHFIVIVVRHSAKNSASPVVPVSGISTGLVVGEYFAGKMDLVGGNLVKLEIFAAWAEVTAARLEKEV
jgi:hypothetical protein